MIRIEQAIRAVVFAALASLMAAGALPLMAQQAAQPAAKPASQLASIPLPEPSEIALPLPEDRGAAALEQSLKRLSTTASVMMIVAHPDDEDGPLLTWLSRGLGVRVTLLTLNRGEGGQNAISADADDALGLMRTNELLRADEFYGASSFGARRRTSASPKLRKNPLPNGATTACSTTPCWPCAASARS
jgi:hypothetical protein